MKLWNYQCGEILDDVDCSAHIDPSIDSNTDVGSDLRHKSTDIRCMTSSRRLLAISFNGYRTYAFLLLCSYCVNNLLSLELKYP